MSTPFRDERAVRLRRPGYTPAVTRRASLVLLAVLGAGVFLAGLELMITAVALPSIRRRPGRLDPAPAGVVDRQRLPARLRGDDAARRPPRRPVGRPAAVPRGARGLHARVVPGGARPDPRRADRRAARPGARRRRPRPGRDGRRRPPLQRPRPAPGARRDRGPDVPRHGGRTVRRGGPARARSTPSRRSPRPGSPAARSSQLLAPSWRWVFYVNVPIGIVALGARLGRERRLGDAAPARPGSTCRGRPRSRSASARGSSA